MWTVEQYSGIGAGQKGNIRFFLSILDVSPHQDIFQLAKPHLLNVKSDSIVSIQELYTEYQEKTGCSQFDGSRQEDSSLGFLR
ncbi:MAG: hypothetical protein BGN96_11320 [Bacteroidales bacterium 45-6]|nr:MAG: hypothetical protein BGN96_11320 [Bacteroidales bacterium 45-6]